MPRNFEGLMPEKLRKKTRKRHCGRKHYVRSDAGASQRSNAGCIRPADTCFC